MIALRLLQSRAWAKLGLRSFSIKIDPLHELRAFADPTAGHSPELASLAASVLTLVQTADSAHPGVLSHARVEMSIRDVTRAFKTMSRHESSLHEDIRALRAEVDDLRSRLNAFASDDSLDKRKTYAAVFIGEAFLELQKVAIRLATGWSEAKRLAHGISTLDEFKLYAADQDDASPLLTKMDTILADLGISYSHFDALDPVRGSRNHHAHPKLWRMTTDEVTVHLNDAVEQFPVRYFNGKTGREEVISAADASAVVQWYTAIRRMEQKEKRPFKLV